jgi:hypothetical protein
VCVLHGHFYPASLQNLVGHRPGITDDLGADPHGQVAAGQDRHIVDAIERHADARHFPAGPYDDVVLHIIAVAVEHRVDSRPDVPVANAAVGGHVRPPPRRIHTAKEVRPTRERRLRLRRDRVVPGKSHGVGTRAQVHADRAVAKLECPRADVRRIADAGRRVVTALDHEERRDRCARAGGNGSVVPAESSSTEQYEGEKPWDHAFTVHERTSDTRVRAGTWQTAGRLASPGRLSGVRG